MNQLCPPKLRKNISELAMLHAGKVDLKGGPTLDSKWNQLLLSEPEKLFLSDGEINFTNLEHFRRLSIFVSDIGPFTDFSSFDLSAWAASFKHNPLKASLDFLKERVFGVCRGERVLLRHVYDLLERDGALDLLRKYPVKGTPGDPFYFSYRGCSFNMRWARHIYFNNLIRRHIANDINSHTSFISVDIGSSYGIFASIFKAEFPNTVQVLADFPDQLLLAYYYLGRTFPDARIATLKDFADKKVLTREYLEQFDFVLLPAPMFSMLTEGSVDMVTNFFSFGEMRREWFYGYLDSEAFKGSKYFFTCNRFESAPRMEATYDTDLTIIDYPLVRFDKIFFGVFPIYPYYVTSCGPFAYHRNSFSSQYFDFIGRRDLKVKLTE